MRGRIVGVMALIAVLASAACGNAKPVGLDLTVREFSFGPGELHVKANQPVELRMKNEGQLQHDWTVERMPVTAVKSHDTGHHDMASMGAAPTLHTMAEHGTTSTIVFTPTTVGEYTFFCTVAGHREAGMQGRIVVE